MSKYLFDVRAIDTRPEIRDAISVLVSHVADLIDGLGDENTPMEYSILTLNITGIAEKPDEVLNIEAEIYSEV